MLELVEELVEDDEVDELEDDELEELEVDAVVDVVEDVVVVVAVVVVVDVVVVVVGRLVVVVGRVVVVVDASVVEVVVGTLELVDDGVDEELVLESRVLDVLVLGSVVVPPPVRRGAEAGGVDVSVVAPLNEPALPSSLAARAGPPGTVSATDSPSSPDWTETDGKRPWASPPLPMVKATKPIKRPVTPATANQCHRRSTSSPKADWPPPNRSGGAV